MRICLKTCALVVGVLICIATPAHAGKFELKPFELVRSFQRIQDEIALGDRHALGMQQQLYQKVRNDLAGFEEGQTWDDRNLRAVLTFAVGGGGRSVLFPFEKSFASSSDYRDLAIAISSLNPKNSVEVLADFDVQKINGALGASIALVRGSNRLEDMPAMINDLDFVRLTMPGTLYEEAALRGLLKAHRESGNRRRFLRIASRYARTFGNSPYSIQFANEMVAAALAFDSEKFRTGLVEVITFLEPMASLSLRDRIARTATVNGRQDLFFAVENISVEPVQEIAMTKPVNSAADQKVLRVYNSLGEFTFGEASSALSDIQLIVPSDLKPENRQLRSITIQALQSILQESKANQSELAATGPTTEMASPKSQPDMEKPDLAQTKISAQSEKLDKFMDELQGKLDGVDALLEKIE
jgi:chemotaxis protein MotC